MIEVTKLEEGGFTPALAGLSLSHKKDGKMDEVALKLAQKDGGHNKFLEQMIVWLRVRAPRYWWQQADTYRMSSKSSESTMHTLVKELILLPDSLQEKSNFLTKNFEYPPTFQTLDGWISLAKDGELETLKALLPEGFLQTRIWMLSYKTLRNIILQRQNHKLGHWQDFIHQVKSQVYFPEMLP
jgi:hypothetical protein